nr:glutamate receptor ionotropic, delta-1-like [Procambarus clarkii]
MYSRLLTDQAVIAATTTTLHVQETRNSVGGGHNDGSVDCHLNLESSTIFQNSLVTLLQELLEGPLTGRTLSFLVDDKVEDRVNINLLLAELLTPYVLIVSHGKRAANGSRGDLSESQHSHDHHPHFHHILSPSVMMVVVSGKPPREMVSPPGWWSLSTVLLLGVSWPCHASSLLQAPLLQQTPAVALLCPKYCHHNTCRVPVIYTVYTWRPFHPESKLVSHGPWRADRFPVWSSLFQDRFASLYGATLHVSSDEVDMPYVFRNPDGTFDGVGKRMTDTIGWWLNFNYTMTRRGSDKKWGEVVNGSWVGMLGDVWRGEKNLTFNYFAITEERAKDFDYSVPYYNEGYGFIIATPPALPPWRNLVHPFTGRLWALVGGVLLLVALGYYALTLTSSHHRSLFQCLIIIFQCLMSQMAARAPREWSLRVFLAGWWLTSYILVLSYTCNLIAVLTVPVFPSKIRTIQDLAHSSYRCCMLDYGEFVAEALVRSTHPALAALGAKLDMVPSQETEFAGEEGCVKLVLRGAHAHLESSSYLKLLYDITGHSDEVYFVKEQIYEANLAVFFRKNTPWKYKFDWGIQSLVEAGLVQKWYDDVVDQLKRTHIKARKLWYAGGESPSKPLSLAHLQGPFLCYLVGSVAGLGMFLLEHVRHTRFTHT